MNKDNVTGSQRVQEALTIYNIALVKSYAYCDEYNPSTGKVELKTGHWFLKDGFVDGFMAGFAYKITGDKDL